jgi:hypothetical protein
MSSTGNHRNCGQRPRFARRERSTWNIQWFVETRLAHLVIGFSRKRLDRPQLAMARLSESILLAASP